MRQKSRRFFLADLDTATCHENSMTWRQRARRLSIHVLVFEQRLANLPRASGTPFNIMRQFCPSAWQPRLLARIHVTVKPSNGGASNRANENLKFRQPLLAALFVGMRFPILCSCCCVGRGMNTIKEDSGFHHVQGTPGSDQAPSCRLSAKHIPARH